MKILIVDDNPANAKLLHSFLADSGDCTVAANGEEALEAVKTAMETGNPFELICLDILMPEIDGHETLRTIREMEQSTYNVSSKVPKIIMTSVRDDLKTISDSFKYLCDGYLVKPVSRRDLLAKINEIGL